MGVIYASKKYLRYFLNFIPFSHYASDYVICNVVFLKEEYITSMPFSENMNFTSTTIIFIRIYPKCPSKTPVWDWTSTCSRTKDNQRELFRKIRNFWAWALSADILGWTILRHLGYFLKRTKPLFEFGPQRITDLAFVCP